MSSIFDIAIKDLKQIMRDRKVFLFMLLMPVAFTFMFGLIFGGSGSKDKDTRLVVGMFNQDAESPVSQQLLSLLESSTVMRLQEGESQEKLEVLLADEKLSAVVIIPAGYGEALQSTAPLKLTVITNPSSLDGTAVRTEIGSLAGRLASSVHTAQVLAPQGGAEFTAALEDSISGWQNPPIKIREEQTQANTENQEASQSSDNAFAHSSPGMILQFAVAGLLTCAQVIVSERKSRCLQRLLTTAVSRPQILIGHYLAIFGLILLQFVILIVFGDLVLKLNYFSQPAATLLIAVTATLCIAAMGLFIGVFAKSEEQAISFSLIGMFVLSGLGGAWVPLEYTGETFRTIGHFTPLAWGMDGFKNILVRGQGLQEAWLPAAALLGYAVFFLVMAGWKFKSE